MQSSLVRKNVNNNGTFLKIRKNSLLKWTEICYSNYMCADAIMAVRKYEMFSKGGSTEYAARQSGN